MVIGITGWIGSGKDTIADYLVNFHQFRRDSFAGTLKDAVAAVFGWDREMLEGRTKEARQLREQVDTWWAERLEMPHLTPRWVLQYWGTEVCRQGFHDSIWIASLENKLRNKTGNTVITDCRFPNEVDIIRKQGGKVVWVSRGPLPEWYNTALKQHTTDWDDQWMLEDANELMEQKYPEVHASEHSWVGSKFDYVVSNDGTVQDLYETIEKQLIVNL
jgi:hypothetical protein